MAWKSTLYRSMPPIPPKPRTNCEPSCDRSVMISKVAWSLSIQVPFKVLKKIPDLYDHPTKSRNNKSQIFSLIISLDQRWYIPMTSGILVDFSFICRSNTTKKTPKRSIDKIANGKTAIIEKKIYIQRRIFSNRLNQTPHHQSHRIAWLESQLYAIAWF